MDISVVLATYNRAASLSVALQSLLGINSPAELSWELLVVDNNSGDDTRKVVQEFASRHRHIRYVFEKKQGRSAALNAGIQEAVGQIIAFTDDDVLFHPDWLVSIKRTFDQFGCAAVAGRVVPKWSQPKPDWLVMDGQFAVVHYELGDDFQEIKIPPLGANSAFRREMFTKYGLFRLDLGVTGSQHTITCDDTEFGDRLIRGGEKIVYCPTAIIYHPVDRNRATKAYFRSWYYYNGVSLTRTAGLPTEGVFYLGVPRWRLRELASNILRWWLTPPGKLRFQRKLSAYRSSGHAMECYRLSRLSRESRSRERAADGAASGTSRN